jgi:hypothetical protein
MDTAASKERLNQTLWKSTVRPYVVLLLLGFLVWNGVIHAGYIALDTPWLVINNPILSHGSYNQVGTIFTDLSLGTRQTLGAEYLPIRDLSVLLDFALFDDWLVGHHLQNLLLYLGACCVLLSISMELFGRTSKVWLLVALYMVMPIHVESVAWLASRKDILALFFGLLSVWAYLKCRRPMLWATIFLILAYWSKNTAIVIPVVLVSISLLYKKGDMRSLRWWSQWIGIGIVQLWMLKRTMDVGSMMGMFSEPRADGFWGVWSITAQVWLHYLESILLPLSLSSYYVEPIAGWNIEAVLGGLLMVLSFAAPIFYRTPALALGFIWFFWGLLPVSQIIPIQNLMADRYLLFPSIGVICIGAYMIQRRRGMWVLIIFSLCSAVQTINRIPVWHSTIHFWGDLTKKAPSLVQGWVGLAGQYTDNEEWEEAERILRAGQKEVPSPFDRAKIHQGLGLMAYQKGDMAQAELMLELALYEDGALRKAKNNLIQVYRKKGKEQEAYLLAKELCVEHPLYDVGWNTLGVLEMERKEFVAARSAFSRSLSIRPFSVSVLVNLGNVAFLQENYREAGAWWSQALSLLPTHQHATAGLAELKRMGMEY